MILLIENRSSRQTDFLGEQGLLKMKTFDVLTNLIDGNEIDNYVSMVKTEDFSFLKTYDVLIMHQSILDNNDKIKLTVFCRNEKIDLVFFSGNINSVNLTFNGRSTKLNISSSLFYSNNFLLFLDSYSNNEKKMEILAYGENWKVNTLLDLNLLLSKLLYENSKNLSLKMPRAILFNKLQFDKYGVFLKEFGINLSDEDYIEDPKDFIVNLKTKILEKIDI